MLHLRYDRDAFVYYVAFGGLQISSPSHITLVDNFQQLLQVICTQCSVLNIGSQEV